MLSELALLGEEESLNNDPLRLDGGDIGPGETEDSMMLSVTPLEDVPGCLKVARFKVDDSSLKCIRSSAVGDQGLLWPNRELSIGEAGEGVELLLELLLPVV